jgi:Mismatch repair ATPase (MutS family)
MQARYAEDTGVKGLKIRHNNVLGYFVEVTAQHGDKLMTPPLNATFIHRQTLAGQTRFTTRTRRDRGQDRQCRRPRARTGAGNFLSG